MHRSATMILTVLMGVSAAFAGGPQYQTGKLLSITDSRSNREVPNSYSGTSVTVTDGEKQRPLSQPEQKVI